MAQNPAIDTTQKMPRKKAPTVVHMLGRILPSRRPEQGGTLRRQDDRSTESAYQDLAIDPETLTHWSIAQDLPVGDREDNRCRTASPRPRRPPQASVASQLTRGRTATPRKPKAPVQRSRALSAAEVHALVKSKERTRRQRRAQKARGDWLGVTGADPHMEEYPVLTPTDSPSSDTTAPSDVNRMAKLAEEEKQAKKAYDMARHRKEEERERLELEKAQSRLGKIERLKSGQKLRHQPGKWIRGRGHWASAAEPGLSTITQSSASCEQKRNTRLDETVPAPAAASTSASVPAREDDDQAERVLPNSPSADDDNALASTSSLRHVSTGTIIHTPAPGWSGQHTASAEPGPRTQNVAKSESEPAKSTLMSSGRHFLWGRRRRVMDPGGQVPNKAATASLPTTIELNAGPLSPDLEPGHRKDHFAGLIIPDHHLGPMHLEKEQGVRRPSREAIPRPLPTGNNTPSCRVWNEGSPVPWQVQGKAQGQHLHRRGGAPVTVISSQSKLTSSTKHLSGTPRPITEPMNGDGVTSEGRMDQARLHQLPMASCSENKPLNARQPGATEQESRAEVSKPKKGVDEGKPQRCLSVRRRSEMIETVKAQDVPRGLDFAYTPTTITTGCAVSLLIRPISQALLEPLNEQGDRCVTPMNARPGTAQSGVCSALPSLPGPDRLSLAATTPKGELKGAQKQSTADADAQKSPGPVRCSQPGHNGESAPSRRTARKADGSLGPKVTQTSATAALGPKAPPPPSRAPPPVLIPAVPRTTTGQAAARVAMLRSRAREVTASSATETKEQRQQQSPSPRLAKNKAQKQCTGDAVGTGAPSQPAGKGAGAPAPAQRAPAPKRDAVATIRAAGAFATCGVWAAAWGLWVVVQPAFDGSSSLWARRSRQQSTWVDVAVFSLAGVSCLCGMVVGLHALQVLWWLVRL